MVPLRRPHRASRHPVRSVFARDVVVAAGLGRLLPDGGAHARELRMIYCVAYAVSNNSTRIFDLEESIELLGY